MQYCSASPWQIFTIVRRTFFACCIHMFSCVLWPNPVLFCTTLQTACLIVCWFSHLCMNWSCALAFRSLCLICPSFTMPLIYHCFYQISSLCHLQKTQPLSHNMMLAWLIQRKSNILILSYLCFLSFSKCVGNLCLLLVYPQLLVGLLLKSKLKWPTYFDLLSPLAHHI